MNSLESDLTFIKEKPARGRRIRSAILVLLGMLLGVVVAYLLSLGSWFIALAALAFFPFVILLNEQPFIGVLLWLVVMPFVSVLPNSNLVYWIIYRVLPPFLLFLAVLSRVFKVREHPPIRFGPPELAMGLLALVVPGTILYSQTDPSLALIRFGDRMVLPFCMYLVARLIAPREKEFSQLKWVALFIALSQSAIGFLSWYAPRLLPQTWQYLQGLRTTGSLKDPDLYAFVLIFGAILLVHGAVNHKSNLVKTIFFGAAGLCALFGFLSLERAAWIGEVFITAGLIILYPRIMLRLLLAGSVVGGILIAAVLSTGILASHITLSFGRLTESDPVYDRLVVFDAMSQMIQEKPVFGWGYETLDQSIQSFYRRVGEASIATRLVTSHNTYMTVLTELGLVGFALYMFPVAWWLILSVWVWPRMAREGFWSRALLGSLWLVMLFNFTVSNFFDMRWFEIGVTLWWLVLGLIANMVYPYLKIRDEKPAAPIALENPGE